MRGGDVGIGQRIQRADQMVERHRGLRLPQRVVVEILAGEIRVQIAAHVAADIFLAQQVVGVMSEGLAVGVVDGGFHRAGRNELGQPGHRLDQGRSGNHRVGDRRVCGRQVVGDFQGMAAALVDGGVGSRPATELDHGGQRLIGGDFVGGPCPDAAHRHRAETLARATVAGFHLHGDVQEHGVGHHAAAELDRRAIFDVLRIGHDVDDADVG